MRAIIVTIRLARAGSREAEEFTLQPSHQCSVLHNSVPQKHVVMELYVSPVSKIIPSGNPEKLSQALQKRLHHYPLSVPCTHPSLVIFSPQPQPSSGALLPVSSEENSHQRSDNHWQTYLRGFWHSWALPRDTGEKSGLEASHAYLSLHCNLNWSLLQR